jgi:GT2 family glycosyltransferase
MSDSSLPPTVGLILHFRHVDHTSACLESLLREGVTQAMLVDNSEDGGTSLEQLGQHFKRLRERGLMLEVCQPGHNLGFSAGVNRGLQAIAARFGESAVLLINNDARLASGSHARLRTALENGLAIAVAEMHTDDNRRIRQAHYQRATGLLLSRPMMGTYPYHSGCCLLISPALARCPLFDESFFFYGDDTELGWRLAKQGVAIGLAEGAIVEHAGSAGSRNGSLFYEYHMARAHWLLAKKLASGRLEYAVFLAGRAISLPVRAAVRALRQHSTVPLKGLAMATSDVIRGRHRTLTPSA